MFAQTVYGAARVSGVPPPGPGGLNLLNILRGSGLFFSVLLLLRLVVQILCERN